MGAETLERLQKILRSKGGTHQAESRWGGLNPRFVFGVGICLVCVFFGGGGGGWLVSWVFGAVYFFTICLEVSQRSSRVDYRDFYDLDVPAAV